MVQVFGLVIAPEQGSYEWKLVAQLLGEYFAERAA
jgi:hypothetical protein